MNPGPDEEGAPEASAEPLAGAGRVALGMVLGASVWGFLVEPKVIDETHDLVSSPGLAPARKGQEVAFERCRTGPDVDAARDIIRGMPDEQTSFDQRRCEHAAAG